MNLLNYAPEESSGKVLSALIAAAQPVYKNRKIHYSGHDLS